MNERKINSLRNLLRTLKSFLSEEELKRYKKSVSFVHVPIELLEQLNDHSRMLKECSWFSDLFRLADKTKIVDFHNYCDEKIKDVGDGLPDIPEILKEDYWQAIIAKAYTLTKYLEPIILEKISSLDIN